MITLGFARPYLKSRDLLKGEFLSLAMFSLLGISVMVSANNFLVVYVGLELMSLSLYALTALRRDHAVSTEAAMKYFVLGALASGFLLYGLSMMYGATGTLDIPDVLDAHPQGHASTPQVLTFGLVFIVAGLAFKLGLAPFHMWVPDVYQGAPTAVTLLISGAPKLAAFGITFRILVEGLSGLATRLAGDADRAVGGVDDARQPGRHRADQPQAPAGLFGHRAAGLHAAGLHADGDRHEHRHGRQRLQLGDVLHHHLRADDAGHLRPDHVLSRHGFESEEISDLAGLGKRSPWIAGVMAMFMFSLAGIPPLVGFYAKFAVLQALVSTGNQGYIVLAVVAVLLSLIGAYYYLRIVKTMFFDEPLDHDADPRRRRHHRAAGAQRPGRAGLRPAAGRPDERVPRRRAQGAEHLMPRAARDRQERRRPSSPAAPRCARWHGVDEHLVERRIRPRASTTATS